MVVLFSLSALFAVFTAWLTSPQERHMIDFGATAEEEANYHTHHFLTKAAFTLLAGLLFAMAYPGTVLHFAGILAFITLVQWFFYDIALNLFLGRPWDYIGETAHIDQLLRRVAGKKAGEIKAGLVLIFIFLLWMY